MSAAASSAADAARSPQVVQPDTPPRRDDGGSGALVVTGGCALVPADKQRDAMSLLMDAASSLFGNGTADMLGRDLAKAAQFSMIGLKLVAERTAQVTDAVIHAHQRQDRLEAVVEEVRNDVAEAKAAAAAAVAQAAAGACGSDSDSMQRRLLMLFKTTRYAYAALRLLGSWEEWRQSEEVSARLKWRSAGDVYPYGQIYDYDESDDSVVVSIQLFHQVGGALAPARKRAEWLI